MAKSQCERKDLLANLVNGADICTLCLMAIEGDSFDLYDQVLLQDDNDSSLLFIDILTSVLALDEQCLPITDHLCKNCVSTAIASYTFIKMCLNARRILSDVVSNISSCISNIEDVKAKTLYITTDLMNESKCYYDKYCSVDNVTAALKRFKIVTKKRKVKKKDIKEEIEPPPIDDFPDMDSYHNVDSDSNDKYICRCCSRRFPDTKCLRAHFIRVHAPKNYECNKCPRKFGAAYLLRLHKSESHITVICAECGKTYNNIHSLKMHSFTHAQLTCPICKRNYKTRNSYRKHVKTKICTKEPSYGRIGKLVERKYICDVCSKGFAQKASLQVHIKFKHGDGETFSCNWCDKKFPAQSRLKAHIVKHTRERNFTCDVCSGKFVSKAALIYHTRIHTGETPYSCHQCDQKFLSASRRMDHIRRKHMGPTMECDICSNKFRTPSSLRKHKRRHFNPNSRLYTQVIENPSGLPDVCSLNNTVN